jgi:hypothetical protein
MLCLLAATRPTVRIAHVRHTNVTDYILPSDKLMFYHPQGISQFACVREECVKNYIFIVHLTTL